MLKYFLDKIFSKEFVESEKKIILNDKNGNSIYINKLIKNGKNYISVTVKWLATNKYIIDFDFFEENINNIKYLREFIISENYKSTNTYIDDIIPFSPYVYLGGTKENIVKKETLIYLKESKPIIDIILCKKDDNYYFIFNILDSFKGNRKKISIQQGLAAIDSILSCAIEEIK